MILKNITIDTNEIGRIIGQNLANRLLLSRQETREARFEYLWESFKTLREILWWEKRSYKRYFNELQRDILKHFTESVNLLKTSDIVKDSLSDIDSWIDIHFNDVQLCIEIIIKYNDPLVDFSSTARKEFNDLKISNFIKFPQWDDVETTKIINNYLKSYNQMIAKTDRK